MNREWSMDAPIITESGLLMPGADTFNDKPVVDGDPFAGDEGEYAIDKIEYAQNVTTRSGYVGKADSKN